MRRLTKFYGEGFGQLTGQIAIIIMLFKNKLSELANSVYFNPEFNNLYDRKLKLIYVVFHGSPWRRMSCAPYHG